MQNLGEIHVILLYDRNGVHGAEGDEVVSGESDNFADHVEELVLGFGRNRDLAETSGKESTCACIQELHIIFNFSAANFHNHTCAVYVLQEMYLRGLGTSSSLVSSPEVPATASCPVLCVSMNKTFLSILKLA